MFRQICVSHPRSNSKIPQNTSLSPEIVYMRRGSVDPYAIYWFPLLTSFTSENLKWLYKPASRHPLSRAPVLAVHEYGIASQCLTHGSTTWPMLSLLLLALILRLRAHLLAEGRIRDLEASDSGEADVEDGAEEDEDGETHEDGCTAVSIDHIL